MLSALSATEVSFLMAAVIQAVACAVWALGAWAVPEVRRAAMHWAAWAALSAITWLALAAWLRSPPLLAVLSGVLGAILLQRGIRVFIGLPTARATPLLLLALVVLADFATEAPALRHWRPAVNFGVLAGLYLAMARDLHRHGRDDLRQRWPVLLALPLLLGAVAFGSRALRAVLWPESVPTQMAAHSALNVGSAMGYVVLVLALHATLVALVGSRLIARLRRMSRHDALTGLLNRGAAQEALHAQMQRSLRSAEPFALLMLDLDHFKAINDRHGHAAGDAALRQVSALLKSGLREVDRLARYGGEEFLLLLPGLELPQARAVAERLREQVAAAPAMHAGAALPMAVSIGVAQWDGAEHGIDAVLGRADAALYEAKRLGRDRVAVAPPPATPRASDIGATAGAPG